MSFDDGLHIWIGKHFHLKCKDHTRYKVMRKPTSACEWCWRMWFVRQGLITYE